MTVSQLALSQTLPIPEVAPRANVLTHPNTTTDSVSNARIPNRPRLTPDLVSTNKVRTGESKFDPGKN